MMSETKLLMLPVEMTMVNSTQRDKLDGPEIEFWWVCVCVGGCVGVWGGGGLSTPVHTWPGAHPASLYNEYRGYFPEAIAAGVWRSPSTLI
jgi:hypothetical protein